MLKVNEKEKIKKLYKKSCFTNSGIYEFRNNIESREFFKLNEDSLNEELICESCILNCYNLNTKVLGLVTKESNYKCFCASVDHNICFLPENKMSSISNNTIKNRIFYQYNENEIICESCLTFCQKVTNKKQFIICEKEENQKCNCALNAHKIKSIEKNKNKEENCIVQKYLIEESSINDKCKCLSHLNSSGLLRYSNFTSNLLFKESKVDNPTESNYIYPNLNKFQILFNMIGEQETNYNFYSECIFSDCFIGVTNFKEDLQNNKINNNDLGEKFRLSLTEPYRNIEFLNKIVYKNNSINYKTMLKIPNLSKLFEFNFIINLLNPKLNFAEKELTFKYRILNSLRKYEINPKTEINYLKPILSGLTNISPVHRLLFRKNIDEFLVNFPQYEALLEVLYINLKYLAGGNYKNKTYDELKKIQNFFKSYLKLVQNLFYYNHYDFTIFEKYVPKIKELLNLFKENSNSNNKFRIIVKRSFINVLNVAFNDTNFNLFFKLNNSKQNLNENSEFIFTNKTLQKSLLEISFNEEIENYNNNKSVKKTTTKNNLLIDQIYETFNLHFAEKDEDLYLETIETMKNSKLIKIHEFLYSILNGSNADIKNLFSQEDEEIFNSEVEIFEQILGDHYFNKSNRQEFFNCLVDYLTNLSKKLNSFFNEKNEKQIYIQILIFKRFYKVLYNIAKLINDPNFKSDSLETNDSDENSKQEKEKKVIIFQLINKNLEILLKDNSFLIMTIFNNNNFKTFFSYYSENAVEYKLLLADTIKMLNRFLFTISEDNIKLNLATICQFLNYRIIKENKNEVLTFYNFCINLSTQSSKEIINGFLLDVYKYNYDDYFRCYKIKDSNEFIILIEVFCDQIMKLPDCYFYILSEIFLKHYFNLNKKLIEKENPKLKEFLTKKHAQAGYLHELKHLYFPNDDDEDEFNSDLLLEIEILLLSNKINLKSRNIFTKFYVKCFFDSPFYSGINNEISKYFHPTKIENFKNNKVFITNPDLVNFGIKERSFVRLTPTDDENEIEKENKLIKEKLSIGLGVYTLFDEGENYLEKDDERIYYKYSPPGFLVAHNKNKDLTYNKSDFFKINYEEKMANLLNLETIYNFDVIIKQMKKFKIILKQWYDENSGYEILIDLFKNIILIPAQFMLHKIINFNEKVTNKMKYNIFVILNLLILSLDSVLEIILNNKVNQKILTSFFNIINKQNNQDNVKEFLVDLRKNIQLDYIELNRQDKNENFMSMKIMMSKIEFYLGKFNRNLNNEDLVIQSLQEKKSVKLNYENIENATYLEIYLNNFYNTYVNMKGIDSNNNVTNLLEFVIKNDIKNLNLKKNIFKQVLYLLYTNDEYGDLLGEKNIYLVKLNPKLNKYLQMFNKIFSMNLKIFQKEVWDWMNNESCKRRLINILQENLVDRMPLSSDIIFMEFHRFTPDVNNPILTQFSRFISFLTLLIQDYNILFANLIYNLQLNEIFNLTIYFYSLISLMLDTLFIYSKQENLMKSIYYFDNNKDYLKKHKYFRNFFNLFFSFFNEYVQALEEKALEQSSLPILYITSLEAIKKISISENYDDYLFFFFKFIQSITFEFGKILPYEIEIKDILNTLTYFYKKLFANFVKEPKANVYYLNSYKLLINEITNCPEKFNNETFQMFTKFYIYINNRASIDKDGPCDKLLQNMKFISTSNEKEFTTSENTSSQQFVLQREIYKFFKEIIKRVEITNTYEPEEPLEDKIENSLMKKRLVKDLDYVYFFKDNTKEVKKLNKKKIVEEKQEEDDAFGGLDDDGNEVKKEEKQEEDDAFGGLDDDGNEVKKEEKQEEDDAFGGLDDDGNEVKKEEKQEEDDAFDGLDDDGNEVKKEEKQEEDDAFGGLDDDGNEVKKEEKQEEDDAFGGLDDDGNEVKKEEKQEEDDAFGGLDDDGNESPLVKQPELDKLSSSPQIINQDSKYTTTDLKKIESKHLPLHTHSNQEIIKEEIDLEKCFYFLNKENYNKNKNQTSLDQPKKINPTKEIYFLVHPDYKYISKYDVKTFLNNVEFEDNYTVKLESFLKFFFYMNEMIKIRKELENSEDWKIKYLFKIDTQRMEYFSVGMSAIINIFLIFSIYHKQPDTSTDDVVYIYYWIVWLLSFIHFAVVGMALIGLSYLNNYKEKKFLKSVDLVKSDLNNKESKTEINSMQKDCYTLYWNFILGFFALMSCKFTFLYSLQLFSIFNSFPTMKAVLSSVQQKYKEFLAAGFIIIIFILFFAIFSVTFYQDSFFNADLNENICSNLLHCFLSLIYQGVRTGSGLGLSMKSNTDPNYWNDFVIEWLFYFVIMLVMLNIINGFIVDSFQDLREKSSEQKELKENSCFICSHHRSKFEACGLDFDHHISKEHSVFEYLIYIYKIKNSVNPDEFSSCEYEIFNKIQCNMTDFFPVKKALSLERFKNSK